MGAAKGNKNNSKIVGSGWNNVRKGSPKNLKDQQGARCNVKKKAGGKCLMPAGWGTDHKGVGRCKWHGGTALNDRKRSWNLELNRMLGEEFEIDPINALMWLIRLAAGDVQYWRKEIAMLQLEAEELGYSPSEAILMQAVEKEHMYIPKELGVAGRRYELAQDRLAKHAKMALDVGIAERAVRLAEAYGETIARLIARILEDLFDQPPDIIPAWSKEKLRPIARKSVSRRLLELEDNTPWSDVEVQPEEAATALRVNGT